VVIASEAIHSMATSKKKAMFIKLDLEKAYDRVSWEFLGHILLDFGFDMEWVEWILSCVTCPSFSVLINGEPTVSRLLMVFDKGIVSLHISLSLWQRD